MIAGEESRGSFGMRRSGSICFLPVFLAVMSIVAASGCYWPAEVWSDVDDMVSVPAGPFWMGCNALVDDDCRSDELPYREVTLSGYFIDKTEVTQGAYWKCFEAGECTDPGCDWTPQSKPDRPIGCVTWEQAVTYCAWLGKRLPTEAEWEKAARGTDGRRFPWGNEPATCNRAVFVDGEDGAGCGTDSAMDVCSKSPSGNGPYGTCDMAGNVFEWVSDWYASEYYDSAYFSNPTGPSSGSERVVRGGTFVLGSDLLRVSARIGMVPSTDNAFFVGFRCVMDK